jgi:tRNA (mo5U34)-methyltransferase
MQATYSKEQLEEMATSAGFWFHSIDLGQGVVTKGVVSPRSLAGTLDNIRLPDLSGKTVLDIGAFDGFFSFEAERRGATRVVALDHYVWSLDLPRAHENWLDCKERGAVPLQAEETPYWQPDKLPGKRAYDIAHKALNSKVETVVGDFMKMDLQKLGLFDVVLFLGVLYHMENPLGALKRVASVTKELAIIETHAIVTPGYEDLELCEFYSSNQMNGDVSNWWGPNLKALEGLCRAAGFSRVNISHTIDGRPPVVGRPSLYRKVRAVAGQLKRHLRANTPLARLTPRLHFRAAAHAWK